MANETQTAEDYPIGSVKTNGKSGEDRMIAVRSGLRQGMDWGYMSTVNGGGYLPHSEVKDWADVEL